LGTIQPSDFVEVRGVFRPNPLADSLRAIDKLFLLFMPVLPQFDSKNKNKPVRAVQSSGKEQSLPQIKKIIEGILADIESKQVKIFVVSSNKYNVVTLLFVDYLRDQSLVEVSHREYRLLGKWFVKLRVRLVKPLIYYEIRV